MTSDHLLGLGMRADKGAFEQTSGLIGRQHSVGNSNLYRGQWRLHIPAASES